MENLRTHRFNEGDVITGMCPNGQFGAYRDQDDGRVRGYGHSRYAAIADLVENLGLDDEPEEIDHQTQHWDHARDLRKNG